MGSTARSSSGPVSRSETMPGCSTGRNLAAVGGAAQHRHNRAPAGSHEPLVEHGAEIVVSGEVTEYTRQPGLDHRVGEEFALQLLQ